MSTLTSPPLAVLDCAHTNIAGFPRNITFTFNPLPQVFIGTLSITESTTHTGIIGTGVIGRPQAPAVIAITMGTEMLDPLFAFATSNTALQIQITIDTLLKVLNVTCTSTKPSN